MKNRFIISLATIAILVSTAFAFAPGFAKWVDDFTQKNNVNAVGEAPVAVFSRALVEGPGATDRTIQIFDTNTKTSRALNGGDLPWENFVVTKTITSAAAATAINVIPDTQVPASRKVYITGFHAKVSGATNWATTATVKIQDTNSSAVDYITMAVAALTGNAEVRPGVTNITSENAYLLGTGGTAAKGIQLKGNANGTGSDLVVTIYGQIR